VGCGKTALATEAGELLGGSKVPAAVVDLDWLGWFYSSEPVPGEIDELIVQNLSATWPNFYRAGARYFVLTRAVERSAQIDALRSAMPGVELVVVRVAASLHTIEERLRHRDAGAVLEEHLAQSVEMARPLHPVDVDFTIDNDDRQIREAAVELLNRLQWI
jgi:hypothetical protein